VIQAVLDSIVWVMALALNAWLTVIGLAVLAAWHFLGWYGF
jgi:hypothetical protein